MTIVYCSNEECLHNDAGECNEAKIWLDYEGECTDIEYKTKGEPDERDL